MIFNALHLQSTSRWIRPPRGTEIIIYFSAMRCRSWLSNMRSRQRQAILFLSNVKMGEMRAGTKFQAQHGNRVTWSRERFDCRRVLKTKPKTDMQEMELQKLRIARLVKLVVRLIMHKTFLALCRDVSVLDDTIPPVTEPF